MKSPPQPQKRERSRTYFYDHLGVDKNVAPEELKKAYRKKSLQVHPDKPGGSEEAFKEMKYAYDVLSDPQSRQVYDRFGEAGLEMKKGNFNMEVFEAAVNNLFSTMGICDRLLLILLLTLLIGYFLLFPILLSVRWDHKSSMSFMHVFAPVWVGLSVLFILCLCCPSPTSPDMEEEDEQRRKEFEDHQQQRVNEVWKLRWGSVAVILLLSLMLLLLVLRLDGETKWSYFLVIWPWILLELGLFCYKFWSAETIWLAWGADPEILKEQKWLTKDWHFFIATLTSSHIFHIVFACLLASKLDGMKMSWWEVFAPFWVEFLFNVVLTFSKCGSTKTPEELNQMSPEAKMHANTAGKLMCELIVLCMWLGCVMLVCWKLSHASAFPAWVLFLPLFAIAGCCCCCLSCILCINPDHMRESDEETGDGLAAASQGKQSSGQPMYGTMR